ncbi:energy transducer TonB [Pedobacter mucosus]|uniref:energy transducer TonB n=1 Tax=Pedobacter mucosus TaxID=2895286 RepID=UPI001EE3D517|nr:energy transducer TonB [Pedobacter mucosus]UKT62170.1 TonB family protein [Pedobacter mucosus]
MFNSLINVYKTEWLDLVFANRNKSYGAYQLRSDSSRIMTKALFISGSVFILFCTSPLIYSKVFPEPLEDKVTEHTLPAKLDKIFALKKPTPAKQIDQAKPTPAKVKMVNMTSKIVVVDKPDIQDPPTIKQIENAVVGSKTQEGDISPNLVIPANQGNGNGLGKDAGASVGEGEAIIGVEGVDEYPEFAGGMKAWAKYMQRNLRYPSAAQDAEVQGKVFVSFVVERDGSITDVKILKGIGYGCDEEAAKVIKKSPFWKPGRNKGNTVRVRYNMPISFTIN